MTDKYTLDITMEDGLVGVELFKNKIKCEFQDILNDKRAGVIFLDLIVQAYLDGREL